MTLKQSQLELWANSVVADCLSEAGDDVEAGYAAAELILSTLPIPDSLDVALAHDIHNRRAQGVLNRALQASKALSASAKKELAKALKRGVEGSGEAILKFVDKYRVQLAKLLSATQLAALLEGARDVAADIPTLAVFPGAATLPPSIGPKEVVSLVDRLEKLTGEERAAAIYDLPSDQQNYVQQALVAKEASPPIVPPSFSPPPPSSGSPEEIHFPVIEEAVKQLTEKNVMTRERFDALDAASRAKAFTVAGVDAQETLTKIRDALAENVRKGVDYATFKQEIVEDVEPNTFMSEAHMENVFRTTIQTQFSDGQMTVLKHPLVRSGFPYADYDAIHDERTRENHLALEKLGIQGTNTYRTDDPVFQLFRPPWDYNDRCGWTPKTVRQAAEAGIEEAKRWLATGVEPYPPAHVPMPPFAPPPGFQRAVASAPLSIQLSMQSIDNFFSPATTSYRAEKWSEEPAATTNVPTFPSSPDEYPRDASNRFLDKYAVVAAARSPSATAELRESVPEDQRHKLDRAVEHITGGGAIHHPKEHAGLAINIDGVIVDPLWRMYSVSDSEHKEWISRQECRDERKKCVIAAVRAVRGDKTDFDEVDTHLKGAGATDAHMRSISRVRHLVDAEKVTTDSLNDLYEDVAEEIHARLDSEYERDPEPPEPEEPSDLEDRTGTALSAESAVNDKEERINLISGILALLFGDQSVEVAKKLKADSDQNKNRSIALGYDAHGNYHGPTPPGPVGWIQVGVGPLGGKIWSHVNAQSLPGGVPMPEPGQGQTVQTHQRRHINATSAYHSAMNTLASGQPLAPNHKNELARTLSVMNRDQLKSLYAALGGTDAIVGSQRQPWVHAIKTILLGTSGARQPQPQPQPQPASQSAPDTWPQTPDRVDRDSMARRHNVANVPRSDVDSLVAAVQKFSGPGKQANLVDVRRELGWDRARTDSAIQRARIERAVGLAAAEGRHGITQEQQKASIHEEGTPGVHLLHIAVRPEWEQYKQQLSDGGVETSRPHTLTSKKPKTHIRIGEGISLDRDKIREVFNRDVDDDTLGAIANAVDGARVHISYSNGRIHTEHNTEGVRAQRSIYRRRDNKLVVHNDYFRIVDSSDHKGKGFEFFVNQVQSLRDAGVSSIETLAAGRSGGIFNGYYTWPRMGYDGTMDEEAFRRLPAELRRQMGTSRSVLDLFDKPGGKEAWKEHGSDIYDATFDLSENSRSMKTLIAYIEERKQHENRGRPDGADPVATTATA